MNLAAIRTFIAIVETGSLVRASERLNVTQSTVTARLKGLEEALGQRLLQRDRNGAQLTAAGEKFRRYADAMNELWRQARKETALPGAMESVCNFGCHSDLWPGFGERFFHAAVAHGGATALSARPGDDDALHRWLGAGLIDAALSYRPSPWDGWSSKVVASETLVLVSTRPDAPLRFDPGYIYVDAGEDFARRHAAAYADADTARISFGGAVWALQHLLSQGGTAYLPDRLAAPHVARGALHLLPEAPGFSRSVYLTTHDAVAQEWPWLKDAVAMLETRPA